MKIIIDTGQDGKVINARVRQKTATLSQWLAKDPVILDGEQAFILRGDGTPLNFRIGDGNKKFSELPDWVAYEQGTYVPVAGSALPTLGAEIRYTWVGPGTYTQSGGPDIVVPSGNMGVLSWDGSEWSLSQSVEFNFVADGKIEEGDDRAVSGDTVYPLKEALEVDLSDYLIKTRRILATGGVISSASSGVMFFIKLKSGDFFTASRPSVQGTRFNFYYSTKETLPTLNDVLTNIYSDTSNTELTYSDTMPVDGWLCIYLDSISSTPKDPETLDLNLTVLGRLSDYLSKREFIETEEVFISPNRFNKEGVINGSVDDEGNIVYGGSREFTNFIKVNEGDIFTISGKSMLSTRCVWFVSSPEDTTVSNSVCGQSTFTSPINGYFFTYAKDLTFDWKDNLQIEEGSVATPYQPYQEPVLREVFKQKYLPYNSETASPIENVWVELERGSLLNGFYPDIPQVWSEAIVWKDTEFNNNVRSRGFTEVYPSSDLNISVSNMTGDLTVFEYDRNFNVIRSVSQSSFKLSNRANYIKILISNGNGIPLNSDPIVHLSGGVKSTGYVKYSRNKSDTISFVFETVSVKNGRDMDVPSEADTPYQYDSVRYYSHGIVRLPKNYSPDGPPLRAILFAHSSSTPRVTEFGYLDYVQYLVDEGYVVFDSFSWTNKYPDALQYMCSPTNNACYSSCYKFLTDNFNVRTDGVHIIGKSHGGLQVFNLPYASNIPAISCVSLAGSGNFVTYNLGYTNPDRIATARDFGIEGDLSALTETANNSEEARALISANADKFIGTASIFNGVVGFDPTDMVITHWNDLRNLDYIVPYSVPTKCWISPSDSLWLIRANEERKKWVEKGGGIFEMRYMQTTDNVNDAHHTVDTFGPFVDSIVTRLGVTHSDVPVAYAEAVQFIRRFE